MACFAGAAATALHESLSLSLCTYPAPPPLVLLRLLLRFLFFSIFSPTRSSQQHHDTMLLALSSNLHHTPLPATVFVLAARPYNVDRYLHSRSSSVPHLYIPLTHTHTHTNNKSVRIQDRSASSQKLVDDERWEALEEAAKQEADWLAVLKV